MNLLYKWEEGVTDLTPEEEIELATWLIETGLVNSCGRYQRYVSLVLE